MDQLRAEHDRVQRTVHPGIEQFLAEPVWCLASRYLAHPAFDNAVLTYCRRMVEPSAFRWPVSKIFAQKMRYITCYVLIGLAARFDAGKGPAPTMTLLQTVVPGSSRQVSDLIAGLRAGGYVEAHRNAQDRREIRLRPTMPLVTEIARSPMAFLEMSGMLENHGLFEALNADPSRISNLIARSTEAFQSSDILFAPFETIVEFTNRDSGYSMLCALMGAYLARQAGEDWALPLTYDALAHRFQVSRQHVGNVLAIATKRGLVSLHAGAIQDMDPTLATEFSCWAAGQMAHFRLQAA